LKRTVGGIRAPSTLGSFLRAFDHGNMRQLAAVHRRVLVELAARAPLLPGADTLVFVDVDSVQQHINPRGHLVVHQCSPTAPSCRATSSYARSRA
jgi:hypothetical protein